MDRLVILVHIGTKEMTTGIYALYWEEQDLIYIGLSQDIEGRFTEHKYKMKNQKHTNYKVQNAFNSYGIPTLFILEKCLIGDLNTKEIQWMQEFDALGKQGLCIVEGGHVGFGTNSNSSKYTKRTILKVFSLLYRTNLTYNKIMRIVKEAHIHLIVDIFNGRSHKWLQDAYPEKYHDMLSMKEARRNNSICTIGTY